MSTAIINVSKQLKSTVDSVKEKLLQVAQNKNLPHLTRWDHFVEFYNLGGSTEYSYYYGWDNVYCVGPVGWYDSFNCDRYQTLDLVAEVDQGSGILTWEEVSALPENLTDEQFREVLNNHPKTVALREALMRDGVTHMVNDW